ncbi:MAG TPA: hypothetical protein VL326_04880 [Kofleriaceae bacterium]|nr:hypothetical protein [Kofleriaceae bacterium]
MWRVLVLAALAGCGRMSFDPIAIGSSANDAHNPDTPGTPNVGRGMVVMPPFVTTPTITAQLDGPTVGHLLVAIAYWNDATHAVSINDSNGQNWTGLQRQSIPTGCNANVGTNIQMFYVTVTAGGPTDVTVTQSAGNSPLGLVVVEYSGVSTLDASSGLAAPSASNAINAGTMNTTGYDLIVAGFHDSVGSGQMMPGPNLSVFQYDLVSYAMFLDITVGPGAQTITGTLPAGTSDACWVGVSAAFHAP